ncbi:uncharacterized protein FTOL_07677 [Fusarium torulosum]|uniref:Uncharacterized protein n=1 Tax=Fusarium torulosum TaxID=33205 RepID=A0AAE8MB75_9HYPO|nr:uncharacterized protein FTOL_07677 [Fusarium torulosum]
MDYKREPYSFDAGSLGHRQRKDGLCVSTSMQAFFSISSHHSYAIIQTQRIWPGDSATNVIVRKDYVSDLEQRVTSLEHNLQRLNDVFKGYLSPCTNDNHTNNTNNALITNHGNSPARQPNIEHSITVASPRSSAPHTKGTGTETCATGLEEPHDEDASTNGMGMTFIEEKTSVFHATPAAPLSTLERALALGEGIVTSVSQAQKLTGLSTPLELSLTALPSVEEAAASHSRSLLRKAENILLKLDHENNLVLSCLEYIRRLARMCSVREVGPALVDNRSEPASSLNAVTDTSLSTSGSADTMSFSVDDMDSFQLFASEIFDPSVIEG